MKPPNKECLWSFCTPPFCWGSQWCESLGTSGVLSREDGLMSSEVKVRPGDSLGPGKAGKRVKHGEGREGVSSTCFDL